MIVVNGIKRGSVSGVEVDDVGSKYEVGDTLNIYSSKCRYRCCVCEVVL